MTKMKENRKVVHILLVEDNPGDVDLTLEAFGDSGLPHAITVVNDGAQAMTFLKSPDLSKRDQYPDLILLDLNLPKMSGIEVLIKIKKDPTLKAIPVVILTTSKRQEDIDASYLHYANSYICKPVNMEDFQIIVEMLHQYWFDIAELPVH